MTREQYDRWKDFALRMAQTCFRQSRRPSQAWIIDQVESWFYWRDYQQDWPEYNSWDQDDYPLCDHISEFYCNLIPDVRCKACSNRSDGKCTCDETEWLAYEQFDEQWLVPVKCCIRAGIDVSCESSAGVLGFTAGDIKQMYPEGVPDWLNSDWSCGTLESAPDAAAVML